MTQRYNKIKKLDSSFNERRSYKPIFIIVSVGVILTIVLLIVFKDAFKLNSIDTFEESSILLYDKKLESIYNSIVINSEFANVYLYASTEDYIDVSIYGESAKYNVDAVDKELNINLKLTCTICHGVQSGRIYLSVPEHLLNNVKINSNYGSVTIDKFGTTNIEADINYGNFDADEIRNLKLKLNSGNVKLLYASDIEAEVETGNITINTVDNYVNLKSTSGNIIITNLDVKNESSLYAKNGSITLINARDLYYVARSDVGIIDIPEDNEDYKNNTKVRINTEVGNISVGK